MYWWDKLNNIYSHSQKQREMKTLSCLMRNKPSIETSYRRTYGNSNMVKRKELRRMKRINIYNKQISGESNPNHWFTPKKLRAIGNHVEAARNNHIGTNPVAPDVQKELLKVMPELSEYQYFIFRNRQKQIIEMKDFIATCDIEEWINKMPAKLRKDVQATEEIPVPEIAQPLLKYTEQLQVYLPLDERQRYNLILKIKHPPKLKLEGEDLEP